LVFIVDSCSIVVVNLYGFTGAVPRKASEEADRATYNAAVGNESRWYIYLGASWASL